MRLFGVPDIEAAIKKDDLRVVKRILSKHPELANHHEREGSHIYPMLTAICSDNDEVVKLLVRHGAETGGALNRAISYGAFRVAEELLKLGPSINSAYCGVSPLFAAIYRDDIQKIDNETKLESVKFAVEHGADINQVSGCGSVLGERLDKASATPLQFAIEQQDSMVVQYLLAHGADLQRMCEFEYSYDPSYGRARRTGRASTFDFAAAYGNVEICELIIGPLSVEQLSGLTYWAAKCGNCAALIWLLRRGAKPPRMVGDYGRPYFSAFVTYLLFRYLEKRGELDEREKQLVNELLK